MRDKNKIIEILRDRSGVSLMFVLAVMLLLMAITTSVLVAASANSGFLIQQTDHNRVVLLDGSVHKNIMFSFQHDPENENTLSYQLVMAIYQGYEGGSPPAVLPIDIKIGDDEGFLKSGRIYIKSVTVSFLRQEVAITSYARPAIYVYEYDEDGGTVSKTLDRAREPQVAAVSAAVAVTVEIGAPGRAVTSRAVYEYTGGVLWDENDPNIDKAAEETGPGKMDFKSGSCGEWRMVSHENTDSKN